MSRARSRRRKGGTGKRRRAREMAVQMLYQQELGGSRLDQIFAAFDVDDYLTGQDAPDEAPEPAPSEEQRRQAEASFSYAQRLVAGTLRDAESIDGLIRDHAQNWRLERMPTIDRNILRLALYEMLHETSVPKVVIVDEAIELAKKFGSENSGRFVNGLLDGVLKSKALDGKIPSDDAPSDRDRRETPAAETGSTETDRTDKTRAERAAVESRG